MFGVIIPVGPGDRELERLDAVLGELRTHERADRIALIVIDDAPVSRRLALDWPIARVLRTQVRERGRPDLFSAHVAGTLEGLAAARNVDFALKLDTDVAIIAPFAERIAEAFTADPGLGVVGSYDRLSHGGTRDWSLWDRELSLATWPLLPRRGPGGLRLVRRSPQTRAHVRRIRSAAFARAPRGAHCLGGAYAVSGAFLARAELDWRPWIDSGLGEDVTVGMLCSAAGLGMASLTGRDQPFALAWRGLPASPEEIAAGGHAIVHSVKAPEPEAERRLRARLQAASAH